MPCCHGNHGSFLERSEAHSGFQNSIANIKKWNISAFNLVFIRLAELQIREPTLTLTPARATCCLRVCRMC